MTNLFNRNDGTFAQVDGASITGNVPLSSFSTILSSDVSLTNIANYFTGPQVTQGSSGTWLAMGGVMLTDASGAAFFNAKLWDGTTVIASAEVFQPAASDGAYVTLAGIITSPSSNIKISVNDASFTTGLIKLNVTGNSKDSWLVAVRIG